jgi:hypothetical protein
MRVRSCEVRAPLQLRVFGFGSDEDKFGMVVAPDVGTIEGGRHRRGRPFRFSLGRLLTFLLASLDSQHTAIDRWASSPTYRSSAHGHRKAFPTHRCRYL